MTGLPGWIAHRLFANYWLLAVCAVIAAVPVALGILWLDREGGTAWLLARDLATVETSDTAKDFVGVAAGINAAFVTLYFSITLIVLSLAAGNLGVRLIDRWVERPLVRVSIAGLSFCLIVSLVAMLSIDAEAPLGDTPLLLVGTVLFLQAIGQDFRSLFANPLSAFRQAAGQYPPVSIRMIDNYARIAERKEADGGSGGLVDMLRQLALDLSDHAVAVAQFEKDRHDIREAFAKGFAKQTGTEGQE